MTPVCATGWIYLRSGLGASRRAKAVAGAVNVAAARRMRSNCSALASAARERPIEALIARGVAHGGSSHTALVQVQRQCSGTRLDTDRWRRHGIATAISQETRSIQSNKNQKWLHSIFLSVPEPFPCMTPPKEAQRACARTTAFGTTHYPASRIGKRVQIPSVCRLSV